MTRPVRLSETHPGFGGVLRAFIVLHVGLGIVMTFAPADWFSSAGYDTHRDAVTTVWHLATPMRVWGALFLTAGAALAVGYRRDVPSGKAERVLAPALAFATLILFVWDVPFVLRFVLGISQGATAPIAYTALLIIHVEAMREPFRNPLRDASTSLAAELLRQSEGWGPHDDGGDGG